MICGGVSGSSVAILTRPIVCVPQVTAVSAAWADDRVDVGWPAFVRGDERVGGDHETPGCLAEQWVERLKCREMAVFCGIVS